MQWLGRWVRRDRVVLRSPLIDPLTGLGTREAMVSSLGALLSARRPGGLALIDVDGFRALRLRRGDDQANLVLRQVAEGLTRLDSGRVFRLHDDVFAVVLPSAGDLSDWAAERTAHLRNSTSGVSVSIGTARLAPGLSAQAVEERALEALHAAKRRGDGTSRHYSDVRDGRPVELTAAKAQALHDVLREGYLRVIYQPIIDLQDGRTIGYEALARPQLDHGLDGPADAFEIAGRLGLIPELDAVCRQSIFADGPGFDMPAGTRLHVNVSPMSLGHRSLSETVLRRQLREAGLTADRVVFELTEQDTTEGGVTTAELQRLSHQGFTLLLDDLGTGSSALSRLKTGLFDGLKIANDVIAAAPTSTHAYGIVEAACAFARHTGSSVIAEGVEDADLFRFVQQYRPFGARDWRIPAAQGYHLGKPTPQARTRAG